MIQQQPNRKEIARRGHELYEAIRPSIEPDHRGKYLVIDTVSGEYEIDAEHIVASVRAVAKHPLGLFYAVKVGDDVLGRIGFRGVAR